MSNCSNRVDVAVIGGGISGLYTAYQLGKNDGELNIKVFEASPRVGGKIESHKLKGIESYMADFAAMRFQFENHPKLVDLIKEMGLESEIQPFPSPDRSDTLYYLRGQWLNKDRIQEGKVPYDMTTIERALSHDTDALHSYWNEQIIAEDQDSEDVYDWKCKDGTMANEKGVLNAWNGVASPDAIEYLARKELHCSEYFDNSNFCDFIHKEKEKNKHYWFSSHRMYADGGKGKPFAMHTLHRGLESLVQEVRKAFDNRANRTVETNKKLVSITVTNDDDFMLFFHGDCGKAKILAKKVILALPKEAISRIAYECETKNDLHDKICKLLPACDGIPAMKTFLVYDTPWWRDDNVIKIPSDKLGPKIPIQYGTDTPVNTVLDLGAVNTNPNDKHCLLLYKEWQSNSEFWKSLTDKNDRNRVSNAHLKSARTTLAKIFNMKEEDIPPEFYTVCVEFRDSPYYHAWHTTNGQFHYPDLMEEIQHPVKDLDLYIVGEAYSQLQGWIQGALETSQDVLRRFFGIKYF